MKHLSLLIAILLVLPAQAQPQGTLLWSFEGNDGIYATIAIPDVDGDSLPDAVGAIYYSAYPSDPRKVYCLAGQTGETLWVNRTAYGTWGNKGLTPAADFNHNGHPDILLGTTGMSVPPGRSCIAIDGLTGQNIWVYSRGDTWGWVYSVSRFVDVDSDGTDDALAGVGGTYNDRSGHAVLISGATGLPIWTFRIPFDGCQDIATLSDINSDSVPEVLAAAGGNSLDNRVFCLSGRTGTPLWQFQTSASVSDVSAISDLNGSGTPDCVSGGWDYYVRCLEGSTGALIWSSYLGSGRIVMELVPIRDVNSDGLDDVVVGSWSNQVTVLSGANGSAIWSGIVGADVWTVDTLADVTGDSIPEVVAGCLGSGNGVVKVFDGTNGVALWQYNFAERVYDVTGAPDMNGDGWPDVLVGLQDHENLADHFYCFSGRPPTATNEADIFSLRLTSSPNPTRQPMLVLNVSAPIEYRMTVFDPTGRQLAVTTGTANVGTDSVIRLPATGRGTRFVQLTLADGHRATVKLISP